MFRGKRLDFTSEAHKWTNSNKIQHENDCGIYEMILANSLSTHDLKHFEELNSEESSIFISQAGEDNKLRYWRAAIA